MGKERIHCNKSTRLLWVSYRTYFKLTLRKEATLVSNQTRKTNLIMICKRLFRIHTVVNKTMEMNRRKQICLSQRRMKPRRMKNTWLT